MHKPASTFLTLIILGSATLACARTVGPVPQTNAASTLTLQSISSSIQFPSLVPPTSNPDQPSVSPTPDQPRILPTIRTDDATYIVQYGDTLGTIAQAFGVDLNTLIAVNQLVDPNILSVGQVIIIPAPNPGPTGSGYKIIPDSELINGPYAALFNVEAVINNTNGFLAHYSEDLNDVSFSGAQVVERVAREFSVNPRLLLAVLEYQSGWLTQINPDPALQNYPMGFFDLDRQGLYRQLIWAANNLNRGFYLWQINALSHWILVDGSVVPINPTINAGTAGVQYLMSLLYARAEWDTAINDMGVANVFSTFFGNPFSYSLDPIIPVDLVQPVMTLPFEQGSTWSFTGGPHGGWGDGSAWAALDFAPPGDALGCVQSNAWVVAVSPGRIVRSEFGVVVLDLDGDGFEQTGWTVLYLHIEDRDRIAINSYLQPGDRIGHPSCEGGVSNGTHVHIARRYNGEWISADGVYPFILDGWVSQGTGIEYDGLLVKDGVQIVAWDDRRTENQITR